MVEIIEGQEQIVMSLGSEKAASRGKLLGLEPAKVYELRTDARKNNDAVKKGIASPLSDKPAKTKEEIEAIDAANAKKENPTSRDSQISTIKGLPTSQNVTIIYPLDNGQTKTVDMGTKFPSARAKPTKKEMDKQFKIGASWVEGNLTNTNSGFVKMPNGTIYEISSSFRSARIVKE